MVPGDGKKIPAGYTEGALEEKMKAALLNISTTKNT